MRTLEDDNVWHAVGVFFLQEMSKSMFSNVGHATELDDILYVGDFIYKYCRNQMKQNHDYLLVSDLPKYIQLRNKAFSWNERKTYFGNISPNFIG